MSTTAKEVAKYIIDKLLVVVLVLAATVYGNYLLERYKMGSSVSIYDSNECIRKIDSLWTKAYEIESETYELDYLYRELRWKRDFPVKWKSRDIEKEVKKQDLVITDRVREFFKLMDNSRLHLGDDIIEQVSWYVRLALASVNYEKDFANDIKANEGFYDIINDDSKKNLWKMT